MNFWVKFILIALAVSWIIPKVLAGTETFAHRNLHPVTPFEFHELNFAQIVPVLLVTWVLARFVF